MNVLLVGSGAREHAIAWKLRQSSRVTELFILPGNGGTATLGHNISVPLSDVPRLLGWVSENRIELVIIGPEEPLVAGLANALSEQGVHVLGPSKEAAILESSKVFSKSIMERHGIPCARGAIFSILADAQKYLQSQPLPVVVKADGLTAGKGVTVANSYDEGISALISLMEERTFGAAGDRVIIEEYLDGWEMSAFAVSDGRDVLPLAYACDYKRVFEGNRGPNTGGMGSYSPPDLLDQSLARQTMERIISPVIRAAELESRVYRGVLYAGLMVTIDGPKVLEFNVRFGDPETQVIMPRLETDFVDLCLAIARGSLQSLDVRWSSDKCVGVVLASGGYPGDYETGLPIYGLENVPSDVLVFHGATQLLESSEPGILQWVTAGGRVLTIVGRGHTLVEARERAYAGVAEITFEGMQYRDDIGLVG